MAPILGRDEVAVGRFRRIEGRLERLKRERDNMGPVNLRAEAEAEELDERISTMLTERDDLIAYIESFNADGTNK